MFWKATLLNYLIINLDLIYISAKSAILNRPPSYTWITREGYFNPDVWPKVTFKWGHILLTIESVVRGNNCSTGLVNFILESV